MLAVHMGSVFSSTFCIFRPSVYQTITENGVKVSNYDQIIKTFPELYLYINISK